MTFNSPQPLVLASLVLKIEAEGIISEIQCLDPEQWVSISDAFVPDAEDTHTIAALLKQVKSLLEEVQNELVKTVSG